MHTALFIGLAASGTLSFLLTPLFTSASFFGDFLGQAASALNASDISYNSQTVPLLTAATNPDPAPAQAAALQIVNGEALMAQDSPLSSGDTATAIANPQISVYTVRDGDTLSGIADMFDVSVNTIMGANDIKNGVIHPGEELAILPITGIEHTVAKGETLAGLASKYNSDAQDIAAYNNLQDGVTLSAGSVIIIPNAETPAPEVAQASAPESSAAGSNAAAAAPASSSTFIPAPLRDAGGPEYDGYYGWPLAAGVGIVTQSLHGYNAVDIGAPTGTSIYASAAGTVIIAKDNGAWNGGYGNYVVIAHGNGTQTLYAHMSRVIASQGDAVSRGELIGKVGATGEATGPHVHFEVRGATNPFGAIPVGDGDE